MYNLPSYGMTGATQYPVNPFGQPASPFSPASPSQLGVTPQIPNSGLAGMAAQGRGGDTMLMHVNPQEVQGIAGLLGRQPTINPVTGLPEAFSWSSLIPVISSIGLSLIPGIGPVMAALLNAGISGGVTGATTGSLGKGILSGVTALALGGAMGKLANVGSRAAQGAATSAGGIGNAAVVGADEALQYGLGDAAGAATRAAIGKTGLSGLDKLTAIGRGLMTPEGLKAAAIPGAVGLAGLYGLNAPEYSQPTEEVPQEAWRMPLTAIDPPGQYFRDREEAWRKQYGGGGVPGLYQWPQRFQTGGLVNGTVGPDQVPALIDGQQPAALTSGEFVIPAHKVNELGNGNSGAGARTLYRFINS